MVCWCFDPPRAAGKLVQKVQGHSELLGAIRYFVCSVKGTSGFVFSSCYADVVFDEFKSGSKACRKNSKVFALRINMAIQVSTGSVICSYHFLFDKLFSILFDGGKLPTHQRLSDRSLRRGARNESGADGPDFGPELEEVTGSPQKR